MRIRLLTLATVGAAALVFGVASAAAGVPGSSYQWQQPRSAPVYSSGAQPQLSFGSAPSTGPQYASASGYSWAQPGTAPVSVPSAQP
jgi:hypothetical protein